MTLSRRQFLGTSAATVAAATAPAADPPRPKKLVMIAGTPSHGPGDHEFNAGVQLLAKCLTGVPGVEPVVVLNGYPKDEGVFDGVSGILLFADGGPGHPFLREQRLKTIGGLMAKGVGLMCAHYAVEVPKDLGADEMRAWIGGCYEHQFSCNPMWAPEYKTFPKHPIANGVKPFGIRDEWYFNMRFRPDMAAVTPILTAVPPDQIRDGPYVYPRGPYPHIQAAKGRPEHTMWAAERPDGGRGVGFTGGHVHRNWLDSNFRKVVLNALLWVCKADVPAGGIASEATEDDIRANLDPKPVRKK